MGDLGGSEFNDSVMGRAKSQQAIDTQIDRLAGELQKNESSEEIHELESEGYRDADESESMSQEEGNPVNMESHPIIKAVKRKEERKKATPLEVELDLRGKFPMAICPNRDWKAKRKIIQFCSGILKSKKA